MKKIFFLLLFLSTWNYLKSQIKFVDINPDIYVCSNELNMHDFPGGCYGDSIIYLDIDSNGVNDLYFKVHLEGHGVYYNTQYKKITVVPLNLNKIAVVSQVDNSAEVFDTIDFNSSGLSWSSDSSLVGSCYLDMMTHGNCSGKWINQQNKYLLIKLIYSNDSTLAFIKAICDTFSTPSIFHLNVCIKLKEYEYIPSANSITALLMDKEILVYPNPTRGLFHLKSVTKPISIDLYTIDGRLVRSGLISNDIDLTNFVNGPGILVLKILFQNTVIYRKIILE
jgi:hypothetical protein